MVPPLSLLTNSYRKCNEQEFNWITTFTPLSNGFTFYSLTYLQPFQSERADDLKERLQRNDTEWKYTRKYSQVEINDTR